MSYLIISFSTYFSQIVAIIGTLKITNQLVNLPSVDMWNDIAMVVGPHGVKNIKTHLLPRLVMLPLFILFLKPSQD